MKVFVGRFHNWINIDLIDEKTYFIDQMQTRLSVSGAADSGIIFYNRSLL
jgi:hypothetical protein